MTKRGQQKKKVTHVFQLSKANYVEIPDNKVGSECEKKLIIGVDGKKLYVLRCKAAYRQKKWRPSEVN